MSVPSMTSRAPDGVKSRSVYRLSSSKMLRMYFVLAVGLFGLIFFIWFPLSKQDRVWAADFLPAMVLIGFILFDIFAGLFLASLRTRLVTSPWGIEYYSILDGIKLRAPWKSVIGVENLQYFYEWVDFLVTSEPAEKSGFLVASMAMFKAQHPGARNMDMDKIRRSIPIDFFVDDWRSSKLGDEIRRYAPQAFGEEEESEASSRTSAAGTRDATGEEAALAFPTTGREGKKRRRLRSILIALAIILGEVMFSFFAAPSIYRSIHPVDSSMSAQPVNSRSAQPLPSAANPLPGQLFTKDASDPTEENKDKALSRDGRFFATGRQGGYLEVVTFPEGTSKFKVTLPRSRDGVSQMATSIALSADGKLVAAGDENGNVFIWQVADGHLMQTFSIVAGRTTEAEVYSVAFSPDGNELAAVGPTGKIKVWNVNDSMLLSTMKSSETDAFEAKLLFDPSGQLLISQIDGTLEIWRAQGGSLVRKVDPGDSVMDMAVSADGKTLALGTQHGGIYLWDVRIGSISKTIKERNKSESSHEAILGIAISPDGKTIVSSPALGGMQVWSVDGGGPKNVQDSSGTQVKWIAFSPDGNKLIYSKYDKNDNSIWVWAIGSAATPADTPTPRA